MSLSTIHGDLLDFPEGISVIAHSCNCRNTMGAGIAAQIKKRYPEAYIADTLAFKQGRSILGKTSHAIVNSTPHIVYNLYTQRDYSCSYRAVNYEAFYCALSQFHTEVSLLQKIGQPPIKIGLPYNISCGLAGGSWSIIFSIIEDIFSNSRIEGYIVRNLKYDPI